MNSCTVAVLNFEALDSDQFTLPGGCSGMHVKNSFNGDIHSASYTNEDGCEAYLTFRQVKLYFLCILLTLKIYLIQVLSTNKK